MRLHKWFNSSPCTTLLVSNYRQSHRQYGAWYSIPLAEHSHYSDSFIYQVNFEAILGILEREVSGGLWKLKRGAHGSQWLLLHGAIKCPELIEALEALADYPCLGDDKLSQLEYDAVLDYWEQSGSEDRVNSHLEDYGVTWDTIHTYPSPDRTWPMVNYWYSTPNQTYVSDNAFCPKLSELFDAGLKLDIDGVRALLSNDLTQAELVALCNSHSHFTDEEMGLTSESARLLREIASRDNPNQVKLF